MNTSKLFSEINSEKYSKHLDVEKIQDIVNSVFKKRDILYFSTTPNEKDESGIYLLYDEKEHKVTFKILCGRPECYTIIQALWFSYRDKKPLDHFDASNGIEEAYDELEEALTRFRDFSNYAKTNKLDQTTNNKYRDIKPQPSYYRPKPY
jgi:hypothetical protein